MAHPDNEGKGVALHDSRRPAFDLDPRGPRRCFDPSESGDGDRGEREARNDQGRRAERDPCEGEQRAEEKHPSPRARAATRVAMGPKGS